MHQEALVLKGAAHQTCVIIEKTRNQEPLTETERDLVFEQSIGIINGLLLHYGTALSEYVLPYRLRDISCRIIETVAYEQSLNGQEDLPGLMRDLLQDLEVLGHEGRLSRRRARELLRFWKRFRELADAVEIEGVQALRLPV